MKSKTLTFVILSMVFLATAHGNEFEKSEELTITTSSQEYYDQLELGLNKLISNVDLTSININKSYTVHSGISSIDGRYFTKFKPMGFECKGYSELDRHIIFSKEYVYEILASSVYHLTPNSAPDCYSGVIKPFATMRRLLRPKMIELKSLILERELNSSDWENGDLSKRTNKKNIFVIDDKKITIKNGTYLYTYKFNESPRFLDDVFLRLNDEVDMSFEDLNIPKEQLEIKIENIFNYDLKYSGHYSEIVLSPESRQENSVTKTSETLEVILKKIESI